MREPELCEPELCEPKQKLNLLCIEFLQKLTSTVSAPKMTALELRKQSLIPQPSSQEAVEAIYAVLNPPLSQNHAQYLCTMKNKLIVTVYD